jgi:hypothetical protein
MKGRTHRSGSGRAEKGMTFPDSSPSDVYAGANSNVVRDAKKRKHGGRTKDVAAHGHSAAHRLDRPARKSGGKVGAEKSPFSAAHNVKTPSGRMVEPGES